METNWWRKSSRDKYGSHVRLAQVLAAKRHRNRAGDAERALSENDPTQSYQSGRSSCGSEVRSRFTYPFFCFLQDGQFMCPTCILYESEALIRHESQFGSDRCHIWGRSWFAILTIKLISCIIDLSGAKCWVQHYTGSLQGECLSPEKFPSPTKKKPSSEPNQKGSW